MIYLHFDWLLKELVPMIQWKCKHGFGFICIDWIRNEKILFL